jgi:hypothetical protein
MVRTSIAALSVITALIGVGCSSTEVTSPRSTPPTSTAAPSSEWLAVLASAADPNDLDAPRASAVAGLGADDTAHVVVSPGACFAGIAARYGVRYVLAITDASRALVEERLQGDEPEWIGPVTSTCID